MERRRVPKNRVGPREEEGARKGKERKEKREGKGMR